MLPHSIQGFGPDRFEPLLVFDEGTVSEGDTTLISDLLVPTSRGLVAKNFGVGEDALDPLNDIPPNGRPIFPAPVPPALSADAGAMTRHHPWSTIDFTISRSIAAAHVVIEQGALREPRWRQNADEWQFCISGKGG